MNRLDRFFLWCSDTDIHTLNLVNGQDKKSKRYQINYGRLLLIPTIMATLGTAHAMSDFTTNRFIYIGVGLMVGWFVFTIDRAIIATYEKKEEGVGKQFWWRLMLSVVMGFVIALFFVFFFFQNRIDDQIKTDLTTKNSNTNLFYDNKRDSILSHLNERRKYSEFLNEVKQAELDGRKATYTYGDITYKTTGNRGRSISTISREETIKKLEADIDSISAATQPRLQETDVNRKNELVKNVVNAVKKDPLIKLEMLIEIVKLHPWLLLFIMPFYFFLLALDIIPILVKELAQITKYDNLFRNKKLSEINLDYEEYNIRTQVNFDNSYSQENYEDTDSYLMKPIMNRLKKISVDVKNQNWLTLCILGFLCGLGIWLYQFWFGMSMSGVKYGIITILLAIFSNIITLGMQKMFSVIPIFNKNSDQE